MTSIRRIDKRHAQAQYLARRSAVRIDRRRAAGLPQTLIVEAFDLMLRLDRIGQKGYAPR